MEKREIIKKGLEKCLENKWIEVNKLIQLDAVAAVIASELNHAEWDLQKQLEIQQLFDLLQKHKPDKIEAVFGKPK